MKLCQCLYLLYIRKPSSCIVSKRFFRSSIPKCTFTFIVYHGLFLASEGTKHSYMLVNNTTQGTNILIALMPLSYITDLIFVCEENSHLSTLMRHCDDWSITST